MDSLYYCPVSARLTSSNVELFTPNDTPIRRFEPKSAALRAVLEDVKVSVSGEVEAASDACFAAFARTEGGVVLVSRNAFGGDDLERITDELLLAGGRPDISGILRSMVSSDGHVIVIIDYQPFVMRADNAEHAEALVEDLQRIHQAGLVHGGINERFLNAENPAGRRVFGVGLSETYAAWRRAEGLALGELRADPRFASPAELRGEPASERGDNFALAAAILCEVQGPGDAIPALDPVQGINALLAKSGQRDVLVAYAQKISDKRVRDYLIGMMDTPKEPDPRLWRIAMLVVSGLSALMLLWLIIPSGKQEGTLPPVTPVSAALGVECVGNAVSIVDGRCQPSEGYGRCGTGTRYDADSRTCMLAEVKDSEETDEAVADAPGAEPIPQGPYIHPVLTCEEGQRRIEGRFSFGNDDINFSQVERTQLARLAAQCGGPGSVVYYVSSPDLEARANTIFDEFRSSTTCGTRCRETMPADPTAVLYVPYIGLLDRSIDHYLFFHCCPG